MHVIICQHPQIDTATVVGPLRSNKNALRLSMLLRDAGWNTEVVELIPAIEVDDVVRMLAE